MIIVTLAFGIVCAAIAADEGPPWITVSPAPTVEQGPLILPSTPVRDGQTYVLTWEMRVEGEKAWRFRADFAGVTIRFAGAEAYAPKNAEKQTSCWQTPGWQSAWVIVEPPPGTHAIDATMAIVTKENLPGRFRVRNARLIDLGDPVPLETGEGELRVSVLDEGGKDTPARVYIINESGEGIVPPHTYAYTQGVRCFESIDPRLSRLALPAGRYTVRAMKGFEHAIAEEAIEVKPDERHAVTLTMRPLFARFTSNWRTTDHHTHLFRHGGSLYPMMDLTDVMNIARAEGLDYLPFQGADKALERSGAPRTMDCAVDYTQELTRDFWAACPVFNQSEIHLQAEDREYRSIQEFGSAAPMNMDYIAAIRANGFGAVAYAHPYGPLRTGSEFSTLEDPTAGLIAREWPIDLALGVPCTIDMLTKEDARGEFALKFRDYMRLLNLGFRCGVTGSTDFHLDQGREPIGGLRTYALGAGADWQSVARDYNEGKTFTTNGPLIDVRLLECSPGMTLTLPRPAAASMTLRAESLWGISNATIWINGEAEREIAAVDGAIRIDGAGIDLDLKQSGWMLVTVEGPPSPDVMSSPEGKPCVPGQYAITSPIYIEISDRPATPDKAAAQYFVDWCDAVLRGFDTLCAQQAAEGKPVPPEMRESVHERVGKARGIFMGKSIEASRE